MSADFKVSLLHLFIQLQLLFWCQASVLHLALPPLAICYTVIGTQAIFKMLSHSWCWISLQQLQNASQTCHATCLFFPSSHHACFPYENNSAGVIPSLLEIKICIVGMGRTDFQFLSLSKEFAFLTRISLTEVHWSPTAMQDTKWPPFSFVRHTKATMQCLHSWLFYVKK